jgi:zinc protease
MKYFISLFVLIFSISAESYPKIEVIKDNNNYLLVNEKSLPIVDVNILFAFGSKNDLQIKGITNFSFELLHQQLLNNKKFINIFEDIGAQFSSKVSRESTSISIRFISSQENITVISKALGKMLMNRNISVETFDLTKETILKSIEARDLDPASILSYKSNEEYFANSNLSHPVHGYHKDILEVSLDDIKSHLNSILIQRDVKFSFVGDIKETQAIKFISNTVSNMPGNNYEYIGVRRVKSQNDSLSRTLRINHDSKQTHISMLIPAVTRNDKDFYNLLVANYIFGGSGFGSMLMSEIREKNGLAYSVFSYLVPYKNEGILKIGMQTETKNTNKAIGIINEQLNLFSEFNFDEERINAAKLGLIRSFELRFDTNKKILSTLSAINDLNMHENYFTKYIHGIQSVDKDSIRKAIKSKILFDKKLVITVGNN